MSKFNLFFCINILITNKKPSMRQLLLQITVWEVKGAQKKICKAVFSQFMKKSIFEFFTNYEKTALQIFFFTSQGCSLVVNSETDKILGMVVRVGFP